MIRRTLLLALVALAAPLALAAQNPSPGRGGGAPLAERVRLQIARVLRNRVGLTGAQLQRVQELNRRLDAARRQINQDEGRVRQSLRDEVTIGDSSRNATVAALLDELVKIARQRADLFEQEQKELAQFMTPMQRAKYFGVQEAVRRRVQQLLADAQGDSGSPLPGRGARQRRRP